MNEDLVLPNYDEDDYELVTDQIELSDYYQIDEEF